MIVAINKDNDKNFSQIIYPHTLLFSYSKKIHMYCNCFFRNKVSLCVEILFTFRYILVLVRGDSNVKSAIF